MNYINEKSKNNPNKEPVGVFTGRCGRCASKNLWDDVSAWGCQDGTRVLVTWIDGSVSRRTATRSCGALPQGYAARAGAGCANSSEPPRSVPSCCSTPMGRRRSMADECPNCGGDGYTETPAQNTRETGQNLSAVISILLLHSPCPPATLPVPESSSKVERNGLRQRKKKQ